LNFELRVALYNEIIVGKSPWRGNKMGQIVTYVKEHPESTKKLSYQHIEKAENQPARLQRLPRIRVAQIVMDYLAYGWSVDEICRQHLYLLPAEAHAAMAYYFDHQEEIDREIRQEWQQAQETINQSIKSPFYSRMKAKGIL